MKKQKPIIRTLTSRSFKSNKTRNLVAILAIVLTTLMFTSLFVLSQSMVKNLQEMNFQQAGYNSHLTFSSLTDAEMDKITAHEAVKDWGKSIVIGVAENEELTGRQVEIRYADENYAASAWVKMKLHWTRLPLIKWACPTNWDRKSRCGGERT